MMYKRRLLLILIYCAVNQIDVGSLYKNNLNFDLKPRFHVLVPGCLMFLEVNPDIGRIYFHACSHPPFPAIPDISFRLSSAFFATPTCRKV